MIGPFVRGSLAPHVIVWLLVCHALGLVAGDAGAATITASVDRPVITFGETVTLTLSLQGAQGQQPTLPAIPNFQVVGTASSVQMTTDLQGAQTVQQSFTYELSPTQAGDLVIPSFQFNLGGRPTATQPIAVKVLPPGQTAGGGPPPAFAKIVLSKTNLYVGEVVDLEVQVYYRDGRITQYPQLPTDPGFTIGKWLQPTETRVAISNVAYRLIPFKAPLTAVKAGALTVGPATQSLLVSDRNRPRTFFFSNERETKLIADKVTAISLPLPTNNVPPTFAQAVGQYSVSMTAGPTNVAAGDPITVRVQVAGRGWLDAITLPPQPLWSAFKTYNPNVKVEGADPNNVSGTKTFELALVPQNAGVKALPAFAFSYFDPAAGAYRTATAPAIPLTVTESTSPGTALPRLTATNAAPAPMSDIAHIKPQLGTMPPQTPLVMKPWFLGLQLVAPLAWIGLFLRRKRAESLANNPRLRRRRETAALVARSLAGLRDHAASNRSDEFFATLLRALQEQIGERLDVPANSVTEGVVQERLKPAGLPDGVGSELEALFQAANLARYAPVKSPQQLAALSTRAEAALRALQQWMPKEPR